MKAELVTSAMDDLRVVNAARVSFDKESVYGWSEPVTTTYPPEDASPEVKFAMIEGLINPPIVVHEGLNPKDVKLINYLARNGHWTPFSHCRETFEISGKGEYPIPIIGLNHTTPDHRAGLIYDQGLFKVRHSLYGWAKMINDGIVFPQYVPGICHMLHLLYPHSAKALGIPYHPTLSIEEDEIFEYISDEEEKDPNFIDITMRETVPIFVARQRFKHMVGFTYNEVSRRYVDDVPVLFDPQEWREAAENVKQGSSDKVHDMVATICEEYDSEPYHLNLKEWVKNNNDSALSLYETMIDAGVAPEQARMVLPQSMYTSYYVTGNLPSWARAYKQRIDPHAQKEIREIAEQWGKNLDSNIFWKDLVE